MTDAALVIAVGKAAIACGAAGAGERQPRLFERADQNGDGAVSGRKPAAFRQVRIRRRDADADGRIAKAEAVAGAGPGRTGRIVKRFEKPDINRDGAVDGAEFDTRTDRRLTRLGRSGDGPVAGEALRAMRSRKRRGG